LIKSHKLSLNSPVFICTVPKCGIHLLNGILASVFGEDLLYPSIEVEANDLVYNEIKSCPSIKFENKIYAGHLWFSEEISNRIERFPNKKIVLVRDPRDYVISQSHFMNNFKVVDTLDKRIRELPTWQEKVSAAIIGMIDKGSRLTPVDATFVYHCIKWLNTPNTLLVRFEDLVGPQFGGSNDRVYATIRSILEFVGCTINDEEALLDDIYMGSDPAKSRTFRSGKIGSWREEFNADHVKQFKLVAPGLVSGFGYEKDESWDLATETNETYASVDSTNQKKAALPCDLQLLNSLAFDRDISALHSSYKELLSLTAYSESLVELVDAWAFRSFVDRGGYREAIPILEKLLSNKPQDPQWNYYEAFCLQSIGENLQQAVNHYNIALDSGFDEFWVRYNRGALFKSMGEIDKARTDLQRAVSLDPTADVAYKMLSELEEMISKPKPFAIGVEELKQIRELINQAEYERGSILLEEVLRKYPSNAEFNYLYALCLHVQKKDFRRALQYYNLALNYGFDEYWVKYNRGSLFRQLGDIESAMTDIKRALELKPDDFGAMSVFRSIQSMRKPEV
jgi:sulfotransferase 6B1